jgi:hypothetical protein
MILGPLIGGQCLDSFLELRLVSPNAGLNQIHD